MYTIANVIYGYPIDAGELKDPLLDEDDEIYQKVANLLTEAFDDESPGFLRYYSGSGDTPYAFGVQISRFNECSTIYISDLNLTPTQEQIEAVQKYLEDLPPELQQYFAQFKPDTFIRWSTS